MKAEAPDVIVCAGGGGVGKTTTSAALGLALAASGRRALVVTIDPARRLAGAMGVAVGDEVTAVPLPAARGNLSALMPDPRRSLSVFIGHLFEHEPEARERVESNRIYAGLADAAAGVHELVAMNLVARAASTGRFDVIVIDTAPSRHAVDFVTYPGRLAALLGGRTVGWLAGIAKRGSQGEGAPSAGSGGLLSWGTGRVEALIGRVTGPNLFADTASLFGDLAIVRERFVDLTTQASELLLGPRAAYVLVAAPTGAARNDVHYLAHRLEKLGKPLQAIVMNRGGALPDEELPAGLPPALAEAATLLREEREARAKAMRALAEDFRAHFGGLTHMLALPHVEGESPSEVVATLAETLGPKLAMFRAS